MIALPDVDTLMAGGLANWLEGKTAERAKAREQVLWTSIGGVVAAVLIALILGIVGLPVQLVWFAAFAIGAGGLGWAGYIRKQMVDSLKAEMNGALAKALAIGYSVNCAPGAEFELAEQFGLLPSHDDSYFEDRWHGDIGGTEFLLYETKLTEERGSGKNRRTVTVFKGVVLQFKFARDFLGTTLVRRDGFKFSLFGDDKSFGDVRLERVKMVDPRFEEAFDVYSNDQVEGRYLVHPSYCERLLELERDFYGSDLKALFHAGSLIVTIESKELFESATLKPEEDRALLAKTIDQFGSMARLITLLNERPRG
jgi:Protein of unknown function (DUF3137)